MVGKYGSGSQVPSANHQVHHRPDFQSSTITAEKTDHQNLQESPISARLCKTHNHLHTRLCLNNIHSISRAKRMERFKALNRLSHYRRTLFPHSSDSNSNSLCDDTVSSVVNFSYFSFSNGLEVMGVGWCFQVLVEGKASSRIVTLNRPHVLNAVVTPMVWCSLTCIYHFGFWVSVFIIWKMLKEFWVFEKIGFTDSDSALTGSHNCSFRACIYLFSKWRALQFDL